MKINVPKDSCIVCGSSNLDTGASISLRLFGEKYEVQLCESHEETTPKEIKDILKEKMEKLDDLMEEAEKYGMVLVPKDEYESLKNNEIVSAVRQGNVEQTKVAPKVVRTNPNIKSAAGEADGEAVEAHESYLVERNGSVDVETKKFKVGDSEIEIPNKIGDDTITITGGVDDNTIQRMTEKLSSESQGQNFKGTRYASDCSACRGSGISPINKEKCPKCGGSGIRS